LIFIVAIFKLLINILQVSDVELTFSLNVKKGEISLSSFLRKRASLYIEKNTILAVSSLRKL
jgi:hypothetical protein